MDPQFKFFVMWEEIFAGAAFLLSLFLVTWQVPEQEQKKVKVAGVIGVILGGLVGAGLFFLGVQRLFLFLTTGQI